MLTKTYYAASRNYATIESGSTIIGSNKLYYR